MPIQKDNDGQALMDLIDRVFELDVVSYKNLKIFLNLKKKKLLKISSDTDITRFGGVE